MSQNIKAVLFDFVGTLVFVKDSVGSVYSQIASGYGKFSNAELLDRNFHMLIKKKIPPTGGEIEEKKWWKSLVVETFEMSNCNLGDKLNSIFESIFIEFSKANVWGIYPDVLPVLNELRKRNIKLGLISNFDSRLEIILNQIGIIHFFDCLSYSGKVGFSKPDSRIFQYALKELDSLPEETLYVGDSLDNDYVPANDLNINAYLINRNDTPCSSDVKVMKTLNELTQFA
jgi:putative hydrolase of the HAD superfamily